MRLKWVVAALVCAACGSVDSSTGGDAATTVDGAVVVDGGGGDGARPDARPSDDAGISRPDGGVVASDGGIPPGGDGGVRDCSPSGTCAAGPACGTRCCGMGEWCDTSTSTCYCGSAPACMSGDTCAAAGPVGGDACGIICCGVSGPCPL